MIIRIIGALFHLLAVLGTGIVMVLIIGLFTWEYDNGYFNDYQYEIQAYYPYFVAIGVVISFVVIFSVIVYLGFVVSIFYYLHSLTGF